MKNATLSRNREALERSALHAVACNTIMLEVCDYLSATDLYQGPIKFHTNALAKELSRFTARFYAGISPDEEMQYYRLVDTLERLFKQVSCMTPAQIHASSELIDAMLNGQVTIVPEAETAL